MDMVYGLAERPVIVTYLKEWRIHAGLTQTELAAQMHVTPPQISRIEAGLRTPDLLYLYRFCQIVGCTHYAEPLLHAPDPTDILKDADLLQRYADLLRAVQHRIEAKAM